MRKLALLTLIAAGAAAAYVYFDRRAMARERERFATRPSDAMLAQAVQKTLAAIAGPDAVQVAVHEGAVTLRGELDRVRRDRALRAALAVPGVRSIVNRLETTGPAPAPDEIPGLPAT